MRLTVRFFIFSLAACLMIPFSECKKDKDDEKETIDDNNNTASAPFYFKATIDDQSINYEYNVNGYGNGAGAGGGTVPSGYQEEQGLSINKLTSPNESAGACIYKTFPQAATDCSQIEGMFHTGTYSYGKGSNSTTEDGIDGVVVYYVDAGGTEWTSDNGTGTQSGSTFEITEHVDNTMDASSEKITKATFNCTLYDSNGNSKALTGGEIRSHSVQCGAL